MQFLRFFTYKQLEFGFIILGKCSANKKGTESIKLNSFCSTEDGREKKFKTLQHN